MLRRVSLFIVSTALLIGMCVWLVDRPGTVTIHWQGWRLDTTVPVVLLILGSVLFAGLGLRKLVGFVLRFPARWLDHRRQMRQHKGLLALTDGLAAVAGGDALVAKKLAKRAETLLKDPQITGLLSAQAAGLAGDDQEAKRSYQRLLDRPETTLSGCQGMLRLALKSHDYPQALDWARRAWATGTKTGSVAETLYDLQARAGQWSEAELTVIEAVKRKALTKDKAAPLRTVALIERAHLAAAQGDGVHKEATDLALAAHRTLRSFAPATVMAAKLLLRAGRVRQANGILADGWRLTHHPDIAHVWWDLVPDEAPLARVSRLHKLMGGRSIAPEGHLVLARAALDAHLWGQARGHLEALLKTRPTRSAFLLLASLEHEERHDEKAADHWKELATQAEPDGHWVCTACSGASSTWSAHCSQCGRSASYAWV